MSRRKIRIRCLLCSKEGERWNAKYCSNACQREFEFRENVQRWKNGEQSGLQGLGIVSAYIKHYLRIKFHDRCCLCGSAQVNPKTGKVPLVADHVDGNWKNNIESNLRLVCPNCDSLSPTYAGLNRGNGRKNRVISKRAREGRLFSRNMAK